MKNAFSGEIDRFGTFRMPQTSWGRAQAVPNHSSYRLPANTTLRKIKVRTKPRRPIVARQRRLHQNCIG
jgi:hypothetical protein